MGGATARCVLAWQGGRRAVFTTVLFTTYHGWDGASIDAPGTQYPQSQTCACSLSDQPNDEVGDKADANKQVGCCRRVGVSTLEGEGHAFMPGVSTLEAQTMLDRS